MPLEQDFRHRPDPLALTMAGLTGRAGLNRHFDVVEAGNLAAGGADEVGMVIVVVAAPASGGLKPPDSVAEFDPGQQFGFGQLGQIAIDRRPIEAERIE